MARSKDDTIKALRQEVIDLDEENRKLKELIASILRMLGEQL